MAKVGVFDNVIAFLFSPLGMVLIAIIVIVLIWYYFFRKPPEDKFELQTFKEIIQEDLEDVFKIKGRKIKGSIVQDLNFITDVDSFIEEKGKRMHLVFDMKKQMFIEKEVTAKPYTIYYFRTSSLLNKIPLLKWFGFEARYLCVADSDIANFNAKVWNLKSTAQLYRWGNVFITSPIAEEAITDKAIMRSHENTLTFLVNYSRKIIYLEMNHAKNIDRLHKKTEIKTKGITDYKKAEAAEDEEAEEED